MNDNQLSAIELVNIEDANDEEEPSYDIFTSISRDSFTTWVQIAETVLHPTNFYYLPETIDLQQLQQLLVQDCVITQLLLKREVK